MSDDARFDPRFDPAFQPGYEGPLVPARPSPVSTRVAAPAPIGSPPAAVVPRSVAPTRAAEQVPAIPSRGVDDRLADEELDDPAPLYRNPFVIALIAIAVALISVALWLTTQLRDMYENAQGDAFDFVRAQVLIALTPLLLVLGGATAIAVLVLFAIRWRRN